MVAVPHEVRVPDLVEADRRQLLGPVHHLVYLLPTITEILFGRQKRPVEIPVAAHAADYLCDRHRPHPEVDLLYGPEGALDLFEGEELVGTWIVAQVSPDAAQESLPAGAGEIPFGLFVEIQVPRHQTNLQPPGPGNKGTGPQKDYTSRIRCPKTFVTLVSPRATTRCWSGP